MSFKKVLYFLLIFGPVAVVGRLLGMSPVLVFIFAALGVIPLADLIGEATEELAAHTGTRLGGLFNATLGNAAELIITIFALREGLINLVLDEESNWLKGAQRLAVYLIIGLAFFFLPG